MNIELSEFRRPELLGMLELWESGRRGGRIPAVGGLRPVDIAPYLGHVVVVEVEPVSDRMRFLQVGRELAPVFGDDLEGAYLDCLPEDLRTHVEESYRAMVAERAPQYAELEVSGDSWVMIFEQVMLPFRAEETDRVAGAMMVIYPRISVTRRPPVFEVPEAMAATG